MEYFIVKLKTGGYIFNSRCTVETESLARKFTTKYHAGAYARKCGYQREDYSVLPYTGESS